MAEVYTSHRYSDQSRHGSAWYVCDWCERSKWDIEQKGDQAFCPKAEQGIRMEQARIEGNERAEYRRMKAERDRFAYLEAKYGGK